MKTDFHRFDELTRLIVGIHSRRDLLRLLASVGGLSMFGPILSACSGGDDPSSSTSGELLFELADSGQTEAIRQMAETDEQFGYFKNFFEGAFFGEISDQGMILLEDSKVTTRTLVVEYSRTGADVNRGFIGFGVNTDGRTITIAFTYDTSEALLMGLYRNSGGDMSVELFPAASGASSRISSRGTSLQNRTTTSDALGACATCIAACEETNRLRAEAATIASISGAIRVGFAAPKLISAITQTAGRFAADLERLIEHMDSVSSGGQALLDAITGQALACGQSDSMCRDVCQDCTSGAGSACGPIGVCHTGECKVACGSNFCRAGEVCSSSGECMPGGSTCAEGTRPVGSYRLGTSKQYATACCAAGGPNCGATLSGIWGGCCAPGTVCIPLGSGRDGYGCCVVGLDPAGRC